MQKYNDYYRLTEGYLRNYNQFKTALVNMQRTRELKLAELEECRVPIANYSAERIAGGELTPTEAAAERMIKLKQDIHTLDREIIDVNAKLNQIDAALASMPGACRNILQMRYVDNMPWKHIEEKTGYSERHCRRLAAKGVWQVCEMIFRHRVQSERRYQFVV